jgi:hypothetical protein
MADAKISELTALAVKPANNDEFAIVDQSEAPGDKSKRITYQTLETTLNHDNLQNFVADEHIDHTGVQIATSSTSGLNGGGTIAATRNIVVDPNRATSATVASGDELLISDLSDGGALKKVTAGAIAALAPAAPVASVNGQTGVVVLDPDDLDDSATTNKFTTAAEISKLAGIEASADVTDAGNVGAVNAAATSKATPVDADSFPIVDSEASSVIKRLTFTNLKAFLETYFDSLYALLGAIGSSGLTMNTARLLGRTTASSGAVEEITIGSGLSLSGGELSATGGGGGDVATDSIWDAKGDLAGGTGSNTAARLPVGSNGQVLTADSAETTGMKWATVSGTGDVVGPASATDNGLALFDGTTGKLIKNSGTFVTTLPSTINSASSKGTPVNDDSVGLVDSADSNSLKKLSWANIVATLTTAFNALYAKSGAVTTSDLTMTTDRILGRTTASTGAIEQITIGSRLTLSAGSLSADLQGDVVGPASATNEHIAVFDGTTGKLLKNGGATVASKADAGAVGSSGITMSTARLLGRTTGSTGAVEEITVGEGLTFASTALSNSGQLASTQTLTDVASVAWDLSAGVFATVTLAGNRTMAAPSNLTNGRTYTLVVNQDGTGSRTLAFNSAFKFPGGVVPVLTSTASAKDIFEFKSDGTNLYLTNFVAGLA